MYAAAYSDRAYPQRFQATGQFVRGVEYVEQRGEDGVEDAVEGQDVDLHGGNNNIINGVFANGRPGGTPLFFASPNVGSTLSRRDEMTVHKALLARLEAKRSEERRVGKEC